LAQYFLSAAHGNQGHTKQQREYRKLAFENAARLPARERYTIEGSYYALTEATWDRAFETLEELLDLYPDANSGRNNLALRYKLAERFEEATRHYEELRRRGYDLVWAHGKLADCHIQQGQFDRGMEVLRSYVARHPESSAGFFYLGCHQATGGWLDEAMESFRTAESLAPADVRPWQGRWNVFILREEWERAEAAAKLIEASVDPTWKWRGALRLAVARIYRGFLDEALTSVQRGASVSEESNPLAHIHVAYMLLEEGRGAQAIEQAQTAQEERRGHTPEWEGLFYEALARAKLGRLEDAEAVAEKLRQRTALLPTEKEKRRHLHLLGELALIRGDSKSVIEKLDMAQSMLPA
jgi:tetratricopeptide (TPR) repeat protein